MDGIGAGMGWLGWTTETHGRNGKVSLFFVGHSRTKECHPGKGKSKTRPFPCFFLRVPVVN
jgi:hypothetical protein